MKLLDRYVARTFISVFLTALVVFSVVIVTLDFFARLDAFFDNDHIEQAGESVSRLSLIARFYAAYLPFVLKDTMSFVTVAAGMFTVMYMLRHNELQPVLAAGVSARRLFLPLFLCGFVVSIAQIGLQEWVLPSLNREQVAILRLFAGDRATETDDVPHLRDGKGTVTQAMTFRFTDFSLHSVIVAGPWQEAGFERWFVERVEPDGESWRAATPVQVMPAGVAAVGRTLPPGTEVKIGVSPSEVEALSSKYGMSELSFRHLRSLSQKYPDRRNLQVALHRQISRPLTSFVLLLLGVSIVLSLHGRSLVLAAVVAFCVSSTYYFVDIFLSGLGDRGEIPAVLSVWGSIALYLSIGASRMFTIRT